MLLTNRTHFDFFKSNDSWEPPTVHAGPESPVTKTGLFSLYLFCFSISILKLRTVFFFLHGNHQITSEFYNKAREGLLLSHCCNGCIRVSHLLCSVWPKPLLPLCEYSHQERLACVMYSDVYGRFVYLKRGATSKAPNPNLGKYLLPLPPPQSRSQCALEVILGISKNPIWKIQ